jgi:hypothetical protein
MEDFKFHRRHYAQFNGDCQQCQQLTAQPLWRRIIEYHELIQVARELSGLVELIRNTAPSLEDM